MNHTHSPNPRCKSTARGRIRTEWKLENKASVTAGTSFWKSRTRSDGKSNLTNGFAPNRCVVKNTIRGGVQAIFWSASGENGE
eukprot:5669963-Pyramimonas_sp.AAC.1